MASRQFNAHCGIFLPWQISAKAQFDLFCLGVYNKLHKFDDANLAFPD
jgi:hypothetical protein